MMSAAAEARATGLSAGRPRCTTATRRRQTRWMAGRYPVPECLSIRRGGAGGGSAPRERRHASLGASMHEIENSIRKVVDELVHAWNCGDLDAFVRLFAHDATYVTATGARLEGRALIRRALGSKPSNPSAPPQVSILELDVRALSPDVAAAL